MSTRVLYISIMLIETAGATGPQPHLRAARVQSTDLDSR